MLKVSFFWITLYNATSMSAADRKKDQLYSTVLQVLIFEHPPLENIRATVQVAYRQRGANLCQPSSSLQWQRQKCSINHKDYSVRFEVLTAVLIEYHPLRYNTV
jgi:hypothetical protein